ncbi:MAG: UDP-N-acetylmuramoyl-L-alanine--D-glutamate ligase [Candidatus Eremiobacteraeota bacterium]|nr:UDP-N-acetylmuramoyl-L-alanine--D-glutamate ligase [Candidatus Eremiobacteraeota bacterium]
MFRKGDKVVVIGVGRSGLATAEVLRSRGIRVTAYDDKPLELLSGQTRDALARMRVTLVGPSELEAAIEASKAAVVSPGVPLTHRAVARVYDAGRPVISEIELAYSLAQGPIIAVTGSKGKSTTTALIGHLLRSAGLPARVGGNIGNPLVRETADAATDEWIVAEVSSFQLEGIRSFRPRISVLLNISPDHLDRYPSMEEYAEAKFRIFANQSPDDVFIGNADDEFCAALRTGAGRTVPCRALWFGKDAADRGLTITLEGDAIVVRDKRREAVLVDVNELRLLGRHNVANAMAASAAALSAGAKLAAIREGLRSFEPLPHRLTIVHDDGDIVWIDDSKATNPAAAVAALESLTRPIILIAGGKSKNTDFTTFAAAVSKRAKRAILIGETAREIGQLVEGPTVAYAPTLDAAVEDAHAHAQAGDAILLSPACASFDMFESAEQRGERFAELARARAKHDRAAS